MAEETSVGTILAEHDKLIQGRCQFSLQSSVHEGPLFSAKGLQSCFGPVSAERKFVLGIMLPSGGGANVGGCDAL